MWASTLAPWLAVLAILVSILSIAAPAVAGGARLAVATEDRYVQVVDLEAGEIVWREPSAAPTDWDAVFVRQISSGPIVIGSEHDNPMVAEGRWFQEVRDPSTGVLISSSERTDGPLPRFLAAEAQGNWVFGGSKHVIDKPAQGGAFNSWAVTAWNRNTGILRQGSPLFKCLIRHWRYSEHLDAFVAPTHAQADNAFLGPWWVNLAVPPVGETSQWASPISSDGPVFGEKSPAFFIEEVATPLSPTGVAWIIGGSWGWKAVVVDPSVTVPTYPDVVPLAEVLGLDLRESLVVGGRVLVANRWASGLARVHSIDAASLAPEWESPVFESGDWTCQSLLRAGSCVVLAVPSDGSSTPRLYQLNPDCGDAAGFLALPSDPRFMAVVE